MNTRKCHNEKSTLLISFYLAMKFKVISLSSALIRRHDPLNSFMFETETFSCLRYIHSQLHIEQNVEKYWYRFEVKVLLTFYHFFS